LGAVAANVDRVSTPGGVTVLVAVVDTGARISHDELRSKVDSTYNVILGSADVTDDSSNSHGTNVASLIAGNNLGYSGNARLMIVKRTSATSTEEDGAKAIGYASDHGARVVNDSASGWEQISKSTILPHLLKLLTNDTAWVVAAGNGSSNLSSSPQPELGSPPVESLNYASLFTTSGQEIAKQTIIVGAANGTSLASFSAYPGANPAIQKIFLVAKGVGLNVAGAANDSDYSTDRGTSLAAPVVSAAVAEVRSKWPNLSAAAAVKLLLDNADRTNPLYSQSTCGTSGTENCGYFYFGQGFLDVKAALSRNY
jgi:subtilisin family serine protease